MFLPNPKQNKNFKYLLTCIDVHSRFVFVEPMKTKSGDVVFTAFKKFMKSYGIPKNLNVDVGSEFTFKPFVTYCEKNNIQLWYSNPEQENKNSIIERFHRTLRNLILRFEIANGKSYIDILPNLIENYNSTKHKTIKARPIDVWNGDDMNRQTIKISIPSFHVGDEVRHVQKKKSFEKSSSVSKYTKKIYTITKRDGFTYYLDDLRKPFREHELVLAVTGNQNHSFEYEENNKRDEDEDAFGRRMRREGMYD